MLCSFLVYPNLDLIDKEHLEFTMINEIEKLKYSKIKELEFVREQTKKLKEIEQNYARLKGKLIDLPNEIEYDVFVPIAYSAADNFEFVTGGMKSRSGKDMPLAFMSGKLVHTNEILVHLGDNWFANRSAKQSSEIAARKLERCAQELTRLDKSEKLIGEWLAKIDELKGDQELVEIHEEYNEEEEKKWREKHRESVRKHKEKERLDRVARGQMSEQTIVEHVVERNPIKEMSKLSIGESTDHQQQSTKPISKFKQQRLQNKK